jgi:hypothetical protein
MDVVGKLPIFKEFEARDARRSGFSLFSFLSDGWQRRRQSEFVTSSKYNIAFFLFFQLNKLNLIMAVSDNKDRKATI